MREGFLSLSSTSQVGDKEVKDLEQKPGAEIPAYDQALRLAPLDLLLSLEDGSVERDNDALLELVDHFGPGG